MIVKIDKTDKENWDYLQKNTLQQDSSKIIIKTKQDILKFQKHTCQYTVIMRTSRLFNSNMTYQMVSR